MWLQVYLFFHGSIGFSFALIGVTHLLVPDRRPGHREYASLYLSLGLLYCLIHLVRLIQPNVDVAGFFRTCIIFILGFSWYDLALFLFDGERRPGLRRATKHAGLIWTACLLALPYLDYAFHLADSGQSLATGLQGGRFHRVTDALVYLWPLATAILSGLHGKTRLSDLPRLSKSRRYFLYGCAGIAVFMVLIVLGIAMKSLLFFCLAHLSLVLFMLAGALAVIRMPEIFVAVRAEMRAGHARKQLLTDDEAAGILAQLNRLEANGTLYRKPDLSISGLAHLLKVPEYRMSRYFREQLQTSFPLWINDLRIRHAARLLLDERDRSVLEISLEAGYRSKSTFNTQFTRIMGQSPSSYRQRKKSG